jgi:hypothetical protein
LLSKLPALRLDCVSRDTRLHLALPVKMLQHRPQRRHTALRNVQQRSALTWQLSKLQWVHALAQHHSLAHWASKHLAQGKQSSSKLRSKAYCSKDCSRRSSMQQKANTLGTQARHRRLLPRHWLRLGLRQCRKQQRNHVSPVCLIT